MTAGARREPSILGTPDKGLLFAKAAPPGVTASEKIPKTMSHLSLVRTPVGLPRKHRHVADGRSEYESYDEGVAAIEQAGADN